MLLLTPAAANKRPALCEKKKSPVRKFQPNSTHQRLTSSSDSLRGEVKSTVCLSKARAPCRVRVDSAQMWRWSVEEEKEIFNAKAEEENTWFFSSLIVSSAHSRVRWGQTSLFLRRAPAGFGFVLWEAAPLDQLRSRSRHKCAHIRELQSLVTVVSFTVLRVVLDTSQSSKGESGKMTK